MVLVDQNGEKRILELEESVIAAARDRNTFAFTGGRLFLDEELDVVVVDIV